MPKNIMKKIVVVLLILLISVPVSADTIYESTMYNTITRGVVHSYTERLTSSGWQKVNCLKVDLADENVDLIAMHDQRGVSYKTTVSNMTKQTGAIAGINADFFNVNTPAGRATPLGLTINDGEVISTPAHDPGLATLALINGKAFTDYFQLDIGLYAPNGNFARILHINKYHPTDSLVMYTRQWGEATPGTTDGSIEMIVENGKVAALKSGEGPTTIPQNGYVVRVNPTVNNFLNENFAVGDEAHIATEMKPDWGTIETAVGGGAVLVRNGKVAAFSNVVAGSHPRTAAGVSEDGKTLLMVTVEGRQANTPGMTQTELANLMIMLGSYSAINFDGGGSTAMAVQNESGNIEIVNKPSDGSERSVTTGLGVKKVGPNPIFENLKLTPSQEIVFLGDSIDIWAEPLDNYLDPITVDYPIELFADDGGIFEGNKYYPAEPGARTVTVTAGDVTATVTVSVKEKPENLFFYPPSFSGESATLSVVAADPDGFRSQLSPEAVKWNVESGNATVNNGVVSCSGPVVISAEFGGKKIYCQGNGASSAIKNYNFENNYGSFLAYPQNTLGEYDSVTHPSRLGQAGCLSFDFTAADTSEAQAVYVNFGKNLPLENTHTIGVWVHGDNNMQWLRAQYEDENGTVYRETIADRVDWEGFKYIEFPVPSEAVYLTRLYVVQRDSSFKNAGRVVFDDMAFIGNGAASAHTSVYDRFRGIVPEPSFVVMPQKLPGTTFLNMITNQILERKSQEAGRVFSFSSYENPAATVLDAYSFSYDDKSVYISINNKGTVFNNGAGQWQQFMNLKGSGQNNFFIFLTDGNSFQDKSEEKMFRETLKAFYDLGKNVFVITAGDENSLDVLNGVRYITLKKTPQLLLSAFDESAEQANYLKIYSGGEGARFEFAKIL